MVEKASKVKTSWTAKQPKPPPMPKLVMKKYTPSTHPMVNFMKQIEAENKDIDADTRVAMMAGFEHEHCGHGNFGGREIAKVRLSNGYVKRAYACDVCGHVGFKKSVA